METTATQKHVRLSPKKLRIIARSLKKMTPDKAVLTLPFVNKRGSNLILKTIKTAIANARVLGMPMESLVFKEIQINEGARLKRFRAASRGRAHGYKRRTSHIRVVLTSKDIEKKEKNGPES